MIAFIAGNLATIIIGTIVLAVLCLIVIALINNKRKGKPSCGCGCEDCPSSKQCHKH